MQELYYTPPDDEIFEEMKELAITIWSTYDDTYGYASEKINRIKDLNNTTDNFMYIFAMFDDHNQEKLKKLASAELQLTIIEKVNPALLDLMIYKALKKIK
jgi:hypothetical protein